MNIHNIHHSEAEMITTIFWEKKKKKKKGRKEKGTTFHNSLYEIKSGQKKGSFWVLNDSSSHLTQNILKNTII